MNCQTCKKELKKPYWISDMKFCETCYYAITKGNVGDMSDGYHTFNELYYHRMMLFSVICNTYKQKAWKSKLHHDGTMYPDYFIVGITTDEGDYTYHYHKNHWDMFDVKELYKAPEWDGHKPDDITRLLSLVNNIDYKEKAKSFIGNRLQNFFCNGFFGSRTYDLEGAEITKIYEDEDDVIVIEVIKINNKYEYGYFEGDWADWKYVYEYLEEWVNGTEQ